MSGVARLGAGLRGFVGVAGLVLMASSWIGCSDGSPTAPTQPPLTADVVEAMQRALQDEYKAETVYQGVVNDLGRALPFVNVLTAEQRHSASIAQLYVSRGLMAPASQWTLANVPHFTSLTLACQAGVTAEQENIALYDDFLRLALPADVRQVFTNNRSASLVNHLPAFQRCS